MNIFDYFFLYSKDLKKDFVLGPIEQISFDQLYERVIKLAQYLNREVGENKNIILMVKTLFISLLLILELWGQGMCVFR